LEAAWLILLVVETYLNGKALVNEVATIFYPEKLETLTFLEAAFPLIYFEEPFDEKTTGSELLTLISFCSDSVLRL